MQLPLVSDFYAFIILKENKLACCDDLHECVNS